MNGHRWKWHGPQVDWPLHHYPQQDFAFWACFLTTKTLMNHLWLGLAKLYNRFFVLAWRMSWLQHWSSAGAGASDPTILLLTQGKFTQIAERQSHQKLMPKPCHSFLNSLTFQTPSGILTGESSPLSRTEERLINSEMLNTTLFFCLSKANFRPRGFQRRKSIRWAESWRLSSNLQKCGHCWWIWARH